MRLLLGDATIVVALASCLAWRLIAGVTHSVGALVAAAVLAAAVVLVVRESLAPYALLRTLAPGGRDDCENHIVDDPSRAGATTGAGWASGPQLTRPRKVGPPGGPASYPPPFPNGVREGFRLCAERDTLWDGDRVPANAHTHTRVSGLHPLFAARARGGGSGPASCCGSYRVPSGGCAFIPFAPLKFVPAATCGVSL
jgi:hypothetical protein